MNIRAYFRTCVSVDFNRFQCFTIQNMKSYTDSLFWIWVLRAWKHCLLSSHNFLCEKQSSAFWLFGLNNRFLLNACNLCLKGKNEFPALTTWTILENKIQRLISVQELLKTVIRRHPVALPLFDLNFRKNIYRNLKGQSKTRMDTRDEVCLQWFIDFQSVLYKRTSSKSSTGSLTGKRQYKNMLSNETDARRNDKTQIGKKDPRIRNSQHATRMHNIDAEDLLLPYHPTVRNPVWGIRYQSKLLNQWEQGKGYLYPIPLSIRIGTGILNICYRIQDFPNTLARTHNSTSISTAYSLIRASTRKMFANEQ